MLPHLSRANQLRRQFSLSFDTLDLCLHSPRRGNPRCSHLNQTSEPLFNVVNRQLMFVTKTNKTTSKTQRTHTDDHAFTKDVGYLQIFGAKPHRHHWRTNGTPLCGHSGRHIHSRRAGTAGRHSFCDTVSPIGDRILCHNHISATS
jgi:hypothetical protein